MAEMFSMFQSFAAIFYHTWWFVLPPMFFRVFKILHFDYVAVHSVYSYHKSLQWVLLEIIPPPDTEKGPKIMESILSGISGVTSSINTFAEWKNGVYTQDRFSLELVSDQGTVHYYIRTQKKHRNLVEAHVYAQYPNAQVIEAEDYAIHHPKNSRPEKAENL